MLVSLLKFIRNLNLKNQHPQYKSRKKYERIRCPYCNATSRVIREFYGKKNTGKQLRKCKNGHQFIYDYLIESIEQWKFTYKTKF